MNIGGRIELRLKELKWERKDLLDRVPDLTSQALFNLIKRDSVRSEWDERIAEALGVSVMWLVYNRNPAEGSISNSKPSRISPSGSNVLAFIDALHPAVQEVVHLMNSTDEMGKGMMLIKARDIAKERSTYTSKPKSST